MRKKNLLQTVATIIGVCLSAFAFSGTCTISVKNENAPGGFIFNLQNISAASYTQNTCTGGDFLEGGSCSITLASGNSVTLVGYPSLNADDITGSAADITISCDTTAQDSHANIAYTIGKNNDGKYFSADCDAGESMTIVGYACANQLNYSI